MTAPSVPSVARRARSSEQVPALASDTTLGGPRQEDALTLPPRNHFDATWDHFCSSPHLLGPTPGHRAAWAAGRPAYAVWAIRLTSPALRDRVRRVQAALPASIRPTDPADLHITVWVAGFPTLDAPERDDDIRAVDLARQGDALARCSGLRLHIGGANSFTTAPFLEVFDPDDGLADLRGALTRCGPPELRFAAYQPHVTLGTARMDAPTAPVVKALTAYRRAPLIEVGVRRVEQLRFDAACTGAALQTHQTVPLR